MRKPQLLDVVAVKHEVSGFSLDPDDGDVVVPAGEMGTIVEVFDRPSEAYEVEFSDDHGETVALVTLTTEQFEVVHPLGRRVPEHAGA